MIRTVELSYCLVPVKYSLQVGISCLLTNGCLDCLSHDQDCRAVVLSGAGKIFTAGWFMMFTDQWMLRLYVT